MIEPLQLARRPTPIQPLHRLSAQFAVERPIQRDDLTGARRSGNKLRKLGRQVLLWHTGGVCGLFGRGAAYAAPQGVPFVEEA